MNETSKTNLIRGLEFEAQYLSGKVLDIGCGTDVVCPNAQPFDLEHGDAQMISQYLPAQSYDTVHSSHCLEHMANPESALSQWWSLVKPGGYLIVVVPHEDLYEQGIWPSRFNSDHKATFRLGALSKFSPVSFDLGAMVTTLPNARVLSIEIQDQGYDYALMSRGYPLASKNPILTLSFARRMLRAISKPFPATRQSLTRWVETLYFRKYGIPVDQTSWDALAQIQAIVQKSAASS